MSVPAGVAELRNPRCIRVRCGRILDAGLRGELEHFAIDITRLADVARTTAQVTRERYPDLRVPPHSRISHFNAGGVDRMARLELSLLGHDARERARVLTDLVVTSVLLDAGAGVGFLYIDPDGGPPLGRSEGLAVASLAWVRSGGLSSRGRAFEVDAAGLCAVDAASLCHAFQVRPDNPLLGVEGRVHLLRALGGVLTQRQDVFGDTARVGNLVDYLWAQSDDGSLAAEGILATLLDCLSGIWPGRLTLEGVPLGDVWAHPAAGGDGASAGLVPLHKLSQWLSYSLLPVLTASGLTVTEVDGLTGLAEYRNGGLFIDGGVLVPRSSETMTRSHEVSSELVVEWRALTVALLDRLAPLVRQELGLNAGGLPLASVLEGGTWAAGRWLAAQRRADGAPPLSVSSDGTVF